jgi:hypothetical protein
MTHESLPLAENIAHMQGAVDFIHRLYGRRGAELIAQGYRSHTADGVDLWTNDREGRPASLPWMLLVCQHCGHELQDTNAMRRHLRNKHSNRKAA